MRTSFTSAAGEHYVAYVFSAHHYAVGLTRGGTPFLDIMVHGKSGEGVAIQVKTAENARIGDHWEWDVGAKALSQEGERLFYVFVDLNSDNDAEGVKDLFVVPSVEVRRRLAAVSGKRIRFWITDNDKPLWHWRTDLVTNLLKPLPAGHGDNKT
jgi:hypothetical protein